MPKTSKIDRVDVCIRTAKWVPVLFVLAIISWAYYTYVFQMCMQTVKSTVKLTIYLGIFHLLFFMFMWSYAQTVCTSNGTVPSQFKLPESEYDRLIHAYSEDMQRYILYTFCQDLPNQNRTVNGSVRYCDKCRQIKPDRAHHCSVCGTCVLKMDHHCPWVNNCISFTNYKFFMLFLVYSLLFSIYVACTSVQNFINFWSGDQTSTKFTLVFLFFVACMFTVSLISLFGYHCYLVLYNRTTLEAFTSPVFEDGPNPNAYNLGKLNNIKEVFGNNFILWFFPISTQLGNGYTFSMKKRDEEQSLLNSKGEVDPGPE